MDSKKTEHSLIESILALMSAYQADTTVMEHLTDSEEHLATLLPESADAHSTYEILKLMDEMPGGFFIYQADEKSQLIYINKAMLRIFQCSSLKEFKDLTGNSFQGMVHPEDWEAVDQSIWEQIGNSQYDLDYVEYRIIRKDGSIGWVEDYGHFIQSDRIGGLFYVFAGDATEKKERQLAEKATMLYEKMQREQKMQALIEEYHKEKSFLSQEHLRRLEVIEGLSVNYESILYASLDADEILPYRLSCRTRHQFSKKFQVRKFSWYISDYISAWVHPEDRELVSKSTSPDHIREKLADHKSYYVNYRVLYKEEIQYLQLRIVNVGRKRHISRIVMGYRRVDKEIRLEMEQKQMLRDALNNANLAIVAKNTFLSNMSHDMRTPLNAIFGFSALARKRCGDVSSIQGYLDKIEVASGQLLELIDNVLKISWTESNDSHIAHMPCSLPNMLQDVRKLLAPQAEEKQIDFTMDLSNLTHGDVYGDPDKIKQALLYICGNAVTYTKEGGKVSVSASEQEQQPNNYIVYQFTVEDNGIGISPDFLAHIFEPFCREQNTTFSGVHGSGLGLTIAKNLVDMMGGSIQAQSQLRQGSTFTITLPLQAKEQSSSPAMAGLEAASLPPQKILLVEDNEINLEIETEILKEQGFSIDTATNGSIAVDKVRQSTPGEYALILMDIQMPIMDGWQATRTIRKLEDPKLASIPIVALSANAFESDKRASIESGMEAHLTKPIDVPQLMETITNIIYARKP